MGINECDKSFLKMTGNQFEDLYSTAGGVIFLNKKLQRDIYDERIPCLRC